MNEMLLELGQNAKEAENMLRTITTNKKNQVLAAVAEHLVECTDELIKANAVDVELSLIHIFHMANRADIRIECIPAWKAMAW